MMKRMLIRTFTILKRPMTWVVLISLSMGAILANDFGTSVDEWSLDEYAKQSLEIIYGERDPTDTLSDLRYYGPAFSVLARGITGALQTIDKQWSEATARHFTYYLAFIGGAVALFSILIRYVDEVTATFSVMLFITQPVLFGHAYINPKDIPLMAFFSASMASGLIAVDRIHQAHPHGAPDRGHVNDNSIFRYLVRVWNGSSRLVRTTFSLLLIAWGLLVIDLFILHGIFNAGSEMISRAYAGQSNPIVAGLFSHFATDAWKTPLALYQQKWHRLYFWAKWIAAALPVLPARYLYTRMTGELYDLRQEGSRRPFIGLLLAAVIMGMTSSIRIAGLFSGVLISAYLLAKIRRSSLIYVSLYWMIGIATMYATWPALWGDPAERILDTIATVTAFPAGPITLFQGIIYDLGSLPRYYLLKMLAIQLTIPTLILALIGFGVLIYKSIRRKAMSIEAIMMAAWFLIPFLGQFALRWTVYNGFRQFLFAIPPLWIAVTWGAKWLQEKIKCFGARAGILSIALLPSVLAIVQLHPYEYVYYNEFVGGVQGAYGRYEMDYWCTSYREAVEQLNAIAPDKASLGVLWFSNLAEPFARTGLSISRILTVQDVTSTKPDYILICSIGGMEKEFMRSAAPVISVARGDAIFSVIREVP